MMYRILTFSLAFVLPLYGFCQLQLKDYILDNPDNEPLPCHPVPTKNQLDWNEVEFYAFFHYNMSTFADKEWSLGDEDERIYAPTAVPDPKQWLETAREAGMRGGIVTVKHHDGFCLWPTESTTHSIEFCGNEIGSNANIPLMFAEAARATGMKYGFYISPWDRNNAFYGTDRYVSEVFLKQCSELASYGTDQFEMWFDGANGGTGYYGGTYSDRPIDPSIYYDVPNLNDSIHKLCPNIIMWGGGGEARWCGTELGFAGETNWATGNLSMGQSQLSTGMENEWMWYPAEADAMATNSGWFWHEGETIKSAEELYTMYLETVGRNSNFILNVPPDKSGRLPEQTVRVLRELGQLIHTRLENDWVPKAKVITASDTRSSGINRSYDVGNIADGNNDTYWAANDDVRCAIVTLEWDEMVPVHYIVLEEYIKLGQRIRSFSIEISTDGETWIPWHGATPYTTVGHKRIIPMNSSTRVYDDGYNCRKIRITIDDSRSCPTLRALHVY